MSQQATNETDIRERFLPHLTDSECVLWVGQPDPKRLFCHEDYFIVPISLTILIWSVYNELGTLGLVHAHIEVGLMPILIGLAFCWLGWQLAFGRLLSQRQWKLNTWYAVTDRRVLVLSTYRQQYLTAYGHKTLTMVSVTCDHAKFGSVVFAPRHDDNLKVRSRTMDALHLRNSANWPAEGFFDIADAPFVGQLISCHIKDAQNIDSASQQLPNELETFMLPDEHVIWTGRPRPYHQFTFTDLAHVVWGLISLVFVYYLCIINAHGDALAMAAFIFWSLVSLYDMAGRYVLRFVFRTNTEYVMTNQRVMMVLDGKRPWSASQFICALPKLRVTVNKRGKGSVEFTKEPPNGFTSWLNYDNEFSYSIRNPMVGLAGFFDIPDVPLVLGLIDQARGIQASTQEQIKGHVA